MKVISRGQLPEEVPATWTCSHCYSTIESTRSEGTLSTSITDGNYIVFECPVCGATQYVPESMFKRHRGQRD